MKKKYKFEKEKQQENNYNFMKSSMSILAELTVKG